MAKSEQRKKAVALRQKGESIKESAKIVKASKSSVSIWCQDIVLTKKQIQMLHKRMVTKSYSGRMKGARMQHEMRVKREREGAQLGMQEIGKLSKRDLLIA